MLVLDDWMGDRLGLTRYGNWHLQEREDESGAPTNTGDVRVATKTLVYVEVLERQGQ